MARILLGITGGIAAYKACELVRLLVRAGHEVLPLPTPGAERFVAAETFYALARIAPPADPYPHLGRADALVIAPLTANTLAKLAHGLADNVLTEAALAHRGPLVVAPAMNTRMWEHPATQANVDVLRDRGAIVVEPGVGELAEGEVGAGRMAEPAEIATIVAQALVGLEGSALEARPPEDSVQSGVSGALVGKHVLVTAGGTREPLDSVRFLGNRSSGRMGVALAAEARRRGAKVTLLAANLTVDPPDGVQIVNTPTAADVERETHVRSAAADVVVMAAAVADYRPVEPWAAKRPKDSVTWKVVLEPTADVLAGLGARERNGQVLVGFGAETGAAGLDRKRAMLHDKNLDLVVYNDVSREGTGFDADENEVVLITRAGERAVPRAPKPLIAAAVLDEVERLLEQSKQEDRSGSA
ncbi:MAG: bifunctional phosphopantothenoylcysteine decarboxylase/phosphopantothenate--cysteine ligase CoaBC [Gaiellaceae bacterium MAG52_C11]|nr:bifunctional phosphopantothenoylcysteine decarboxylase/phosphopantothenate--cysteine ligase CoaBC [Candidatus Gaiellasilicea maunaloa]